MKGLGTKVSFPDLPAQAALCCCAQKPKIFEISLVPSLSPPRSQRLHQQNPRATGDWVVFRLGKVGDSLRMERKRVRNCANIMVSRIMVFSTFGFHKPYIPFSMLSAPCRFEHPRPEWYIIETMVGSIWMLKMHDIGCDSFSLDGFDGQSATLDNMDQLENKRAKILGERPRTGKINVNDFSH